MAHCIVNEGLGMTIPARKHDEHLIYYSPLQPYLENEGSNFLNLNVPPSFDTRCRSPTTLLDLTGDAFNRKSRSRNSLTSSEGDVVTESYSQPKNENLGKIIVCESDHESTYQIPLEDYQKVEEVFDSYGLNSLPVITPEQTSEILQLIDKYLQEEGHDANMSKKTGRIMVYDYDQESTYQTPLEDCKNVKTLYSNDSSYSLPAIAPESTSEMLQMIDEYLQEEGHNSNMPKLLAIPSYASQNCSAALKEMSPNDANGILFQRCRAQKHGEFMTPSMPPSRPPQTPSPYQKENGNSWKKENVPPRPQTISPHQSSMHFLGNQIKPETFSFPNVKVSTTAGFDSQANFAYDSASHTSERKDRPTGINGGSMFRQYLTSSSLTGASMPDTSKNTSATSESLKTNYSKKRRLDTIQSSEDAEIEGSKSKHTQSAIPRYGKLNNGAPVQEIQPNGVNERLRNASQVQIHDEYVTPYTPPPRLPLSPYQKKERSFDKGHDVLPSPATCRCQSFGLYKDKIKARPLHEPYRKQSDASYTKQSGHTSVQGTAPNSITEGMGYSNPGRKCEDYIFTYKPPVQPSPMKGQSNFSKLDANASITNSDLQRRPQSLSPSWRWH